MKALRECSRALSALRNQRRVLGLLPSKFLVLVDVSRQEVSVFRGGNWLRTLRCSTSKFGLGQVEGSNCTPLGLHRVARKIGAGWPVGTVFKSRQPVGFTWRGMPGASITTRIFWLEGLEPGFNRGGKTDSFSRYIYIHGTGDEPSLGRPASHGCVHLAADDLSPLHDELPVGTLVWIHRA